MKKLAISTLALAISFAAAGMTEAASKKPLKRSSFTTKQREAIMAQGRKVCRKKYGAMATVYEVDYYHRRFICTT